MGSADHSPLLPPCCAPNKSRNVSAAVPLELSVIAGAKLELAEGGREVHSIKLSLTVQEVGAQLL